MHLVNEKNFNELAELYDAFQNKDVVLGISPGAVFKNGGLKFLIKSRMTKEMVDGIMEADVDHKNLQKAVEKTKIHKLLKKVGKDFYALSPKWSDDNKKEVIFWLNPMQQQKYNDGWYTVAELKQWAKDEGPIMRSPIANTRRPIKS